MSGNYRTITAGPEFTAEEVEYHAAHTTGRWRMMRSDGRAWQCTALVPWRFPIPPVEERERLREEARG
jgi:hypothetical protein